MLAVPLAMAAGGYMIDKYAMGGDGTKGAIMGGAAGAGKGPAGAAAGAGAGAGAASTIPAHLVTAPTVAGAVGGTAATTGSAALGSQMASQLGSGVGGYSTAIPAATGKTMSANITPKNTSLFNMPNMDMPSVDGILDTGKEYAGKAYDYVANEFDDMSLSDKANVGLIGYNALGQSNPTPTRVSNADLLQSNYQNPKDGLLDISVSGNSNDYNAKTIPQSLTKEQLQELQLAGII